MTGKYRKLTEILKKRNGIACVGEKLKGIKIKEFGDEYDE